MGSPTPTTAPLSGVYEVVRRPVTEPSVEKLLTVLVWVPPGPAATAVTSYWAPGSRPSLAVQVRPSVESCPATAAPPTLVTATVVRLPTLLDTVTGHRGRPRWRGRP